LSLEINQLDELAAVPADDDVFAIDDLTAPITTKKLTFARLRTGALIFTNKTIDLDANTLTGTVAEFNTALQGDTFAFISDKLDVFAATSSAELLGVISDETGSGLLVFNDSPTFITPALGTPSSGTLDMTNITLDGTVGEFNTALSGDSFAFLAVANVFTQNQAVRKTALPTMSVARNASLTSGQVMARYDAQSEDDLGAENITYGRIDWSMRDNTNTSKDSAWQLKLMNNNILTAFLTIRGDLTEVQVDNADLEIDSGKQFRVDGGGDTYIHEASANVFEIVEGGNVISMPAIGGDDTLAALGTIQTWTAKQTHKADDVWAKPTGSPMTLTYRRDEATTAVSAQMAFQGKNSDGAQGTQNIGSIVSRLSDTTEAGADGRYLFQVTEDGNDNQVYFEIDGGNARVECFKDLALTATKKLSFDNGGDTFLFEVSANILDLHIGDGTDESIKFENTVMTFKDAFDLAAGTTTGTKIGTGTTQKLSFWNATPVVQPGHIVDPTDLATAITAINAILADLAELGLQAAS